MRTSKSRSRGKRPNNNRSTGNIMNRVFDSSGPEGKVRGTPQQIIEKYSQLHRDAQLSNDLVAAENFQQHAEHYARMLTDAQRELARKEAADSLQQNSNSPVIEGSVKDNSLNRNEKGSFESNKTRKENSGSNKPRNNGYSVKDDSIEEATLPSSTLTQNSSDIDLPEEPQENDSVSSKNVIT